MQNAFTTPLIKQIINMLIDSITYNDLSIVLSDIIFILVNKNSSTYTQRYKHALEEIRINLLYKIAHYPNEKVTEIDKHSIIKLLYQENLEELIFDNSTQLKINHYLNICKNSDIKSISKVTANKCIIDPFGNPISNINNVQIDIQETNDQLLKYLSQNPNYIYQLSSRKFEELIAEILIRKGYEVELTPATRDGGKDIYAAHKTDLGSFLYIIECKKYAPNNKIGVSILRDLYGVVSKENATCGIIATTSYFTKPAKDFQREVQFQMSLKDFDSIKQWLYEVT